MKKTRYDPFAFVWLTCLSGKSYACCALPAFDGLIWTQVFAEASRNTWYTDMLFFVSKCSQLTVNADWSQQIFGRAKYACMLWCSDLIGVCEVMFCKHSKQNTLVLPQNDGNLNVGRNRQTCATKWDCRRFCPIIGVAAIACIMTSGHDT